MFIAQNVGGERVGVQRMADEPGRTTPLEERVHARPGTRGVRCMPVYAERLEPAVLA
jgi:hypothetical protein